MQVVLKAASQVVQSRTEASQDCGRLAHIVQRAGQSVAELNELIHRELMRKGAAQTLESKPKASHTAFLKRHGKLRSLKIELQEVKLTLLIAVGTLTL